ncbi:MAG: GNAT family N-acetyltransferase [Frankiaceae bacterium]|nr:GNAT family N-acetyltransferase [Frankiaceae bacterium]
MIGGGADTVLSLPRSGRTVRVRELTPADLPALRRAFVNADPAVLRTRFAGAAPKFDTLARRVLALDGHARHAVAAFTADDQVVGVAEYERTEPGATAEVAVVVATAWQHEGVATALLQRLAEHALREGVTTATALISGSNSQVLELVRDIPMNHSVSYDHGAGELRVDLTDAVDARAVPRAKEA